MEYDRGTEAFGALARKLEGYLRLAANWTKEQDFVGFPSLLITVPEGVREGEVRRVTSLDPRRSRADIEHERSTVTIREGTRFRQTDEKTRRRLRLFGPLLILVTLSLSLFPPARTDRFPLQRVRRRRDARPAAGGGEHRGVRPSQGPADRLPQHSCAVQALLREATLNAFPRDEGNPGNLRLTTSRLLLTTDEPGRVNLYVVQTDKLWVCSVLVPSGPDYCSTDFGYTTWTPTSDGGSGTYVFGLAPDDVSVVEVRFEDETCSAPVIANGFVCSSSKVQTALPQVIPIPIGG